MTFYATLCAATAADRNALLASPVITDCLAGVVSRETYIAFLVQAYHHVRHTVPLLMACGSRLPERLEWLRAGIVEYIDEEHGHEQWILDDLDACGVDCAAAVRRGAALPTTIMVAYVYDMITRINPVGFFGMVYVLEGTSAAIATRAASVIQNELGLPARACRYLRSHGSIDVQHLGNFERLVNRFDDAEDQIAVIQCARAVFKLYGEMFRGLPHTATHSQRKTA